MVPTLEERRTSTCAEVKRSAKVVAGEVIVLLGLHDLELTNAIELKLFRREARPDCRDRPAQRTAYDPVRTQCPSRRCTRVPLAAEASGPDDLTACQRQRPNLFDKRRHRVRQHGHHPAIKSIQWRRTRSCAIVASGLRERMLGARLGRRVAGVATRSGRARRPMAPDPRLQPSCVLGVQARGAL